jgi:putative hemolysin
VSGGSIAAVVVLVASTALLILLASAEAGVISVSRSRARLLLSKEPENPRARWLHDVIQERERALGSFAVGRTLAVVTGLAAAIFLFGKEIEFGWEVVTGTAAVSFVVIALLQAVPRRLAETRPEGFGLRLALTMRRFRAVFRIPAAVFEAPAFLAWPVTGTAARETIEPEPLEMLLEREEGGEGIEEDEREMIRGVFEIGETAVREAMVPRPDIVAMEVESSLSAAAQKVVERGVSRMPVYEEIIDNVVGVLYAKDILASQVAGEQDKSVRELMRQPLVVPEAKRVDEMLAQFRRSRVHIAIVLDEYGGTAGLVTMEDLLEEIVGEIEDEFDASAASVVRVSDNEAWLDGRASIDELKELFDVQIDEGDFDTVAGYVFERLGKIPAVGDTVQVNELTIAVQSMTGHRIAKLRVRRLPTATSAAPTSEDGNRGVA